jgi:hypothetical protein
MTNCRNFMQVLCAVATLCAIGALPASASASAAETPTDDTVATVPELAGSVSATADCDGVTVTTSDWAPGTAAGLGLDASPPRAMALNGTVHLPWSLPSATHAYSVVVFGGGYASGSVADCTSGPWPTVPAQATVRPAYVPLVEVHAVPVPVSEPVTVVESVRMRRNGAW